MIQVLSQVNFLVQSGHSFFILHEFFPIHDLNIFIKCLQSLKLIFQVLTLEILFNQVSLQFLIVIFHFGHFVLHFLFGLVDLHAGNCFELVFLSVELCSELPSDTCVVKSAHLVLFVLTFEGIVELLDVLIESVSVGLHFFNNKLELFVLPFTLVNLSLKLFFLSPPLSFLLPEFFLKFLVLLSVLIFGFLPLFTLLFPTSLDFQNHGVVLLFDA